MTKSAQDLLKGFPEGLLQEIARKIAADFIASHDMSQIIRKYALRKGAYHLLVDRTVDKGPPVQGISSEDLSMEILSLLGDIFMGKPLSATLSIALARQDVNQMRTLLKQECRSLLADRSRNPRFRAIRTILHDASQEGTLSYHPGPGLYSRSEDRWACYAFSGQEGLPVIRGRLEGETYGNWPFPPFLEGATSSISCMTQKDLVLESAPFFWREVSRRYGAGLVRVFDLQCYMEAKLPFWLMRSLLPDPLKDNVFEGGQEEDQAAGSDGDPTPVVGGRRNTSQPAEDTATVLLEQAIMKDKMASLAREWLMMLTPEDASIFCMMFHCEYGSTETARKLGWKSPQIVDYHYKFCQRELRSFCTQQAGLSPPDTDKGMVWLFARMLRHVCEGDVLKGGCE